MELTDILRCPKTGNKLRFHDGDSMVYVEHSDVTYPIIDGIIDFCPEAEDTISTSYDALASRYDAMMMPRPNVFRDVYGKIIWGFPSDPAYVMDAILPYLPSQFDGILLDVPVGTGLFTCSLYAGFPNATIIAIDYSMGMLQKARERFEQHGLSNIHLLRADVANLPVRDAAVDMLLSMNGVHAFPDKQRAVAEMGRVIRDQGTLVACFYARGAKRITDWVVKYFAVPRGCFTAPFFHVDDIASQFEGFTIEQKGNLNSFVYFKAVR